MGLDTVELIVCTEKYFKISIPDPEAAKLNTVQDIADCVFAKIIGEKRSLEKVGR